MKWIIIVASSVAALILLVVIIGYMLPVKHRAVRSAVFNTDQESLYALIINVDALPTWRSSVSSIEHDGDKYREVQGRDAILYEYLERSPNRVVTRIADKSLPFGGSWTYELTLESSTQTRLRITEDGEVYNPIFRFVSKFMMGHTSTIDGYLRDVGRYLKEEPVIT